MKKSITPNLIKQNNRNLIYLYILHNPGVSQQDIAYELRLSRPTVTTNLSELEAAGMIQKSGQLDTELVGRKAIAYSAVKDYRISIGVDIHDKEVKLIAVNLLGEYSSRVVHNIKYANTDKYRQKVCNLVKEYIEDCQLQKEQILGIGIAMPGLVSMDGTTMTYGKILDCTGLTIDGFSKYLPYPCRFFHDSESAAVSELWAAPELQNAMYLQIGIHLGAAMIMNRKIMGGIHGHNATVEHIFIGKNGKKCYCGREGCAETIASLSSLCGDEPVHSFFERVNSRDASATARLDNYLKDLATVINSVHLIYDQDVILGGFIAPYLTEGDIDKLHKYVQDLNPFEDTARYIYISRMPKHNITIGAALPYITEFLSRIDIA